MRILCNFLKHVMNKIRQNLPETMETRDHDEIRYVQPYLKLKYNFLFPYLFSFQIINFTRYPKQRRFAFVYQRSFR